MYQVLAIIRRYTDVDDVTQTSQKSHNLLILWLQRWRTSVFFCQARGQRTTNNPPYVLPFAIGLTTGTESLCSVARPAGYSFGYTPPNAVETITADIKNHWCFMDIIIVFPFHEIFHTKNARSFGITVDIISNTTGRYNNSITQLDKWINIVEITE